MSILEEVACKVCRRPVPLELVAAGSKTCGAARCSYRWRRWSDPLERRRGQLVKAAGGPGLLLWNDERLLQRLGLDRREAGEQLLRLARARGLEVAWRKDGTVLAAARIAPERRRFLTQPEVRPAGRGGAR